LKDADNLEGGADGTIVWTGHVLDGVVERVDDRCRDGMSDEVEMAKERGRLRRNDRLGGTLTECFYAKV
jgi:hypothetical protein